MFVNVCVTRPIRYCWARRLDNNNEKEIFFCDTNGNVVDELDAYMETNYFERNCAE